MQIYGLISYFSDDKKKDCGTNNSSKTSQIYKENIALQLVSIKIKILTKFKTK